MKAIAKKKDRLKFESKVYEQKFALSYDFPVYFSRDIFNTLHGLLEEVISRYHEEKMHRVKIFIDDGAAGAFPNLAENIETYFADHGETLELVGAPEVVPGGEKSKEGWAEAQKIMDSIARERLCRQSFVLAVGGGSVLDVVGLAASLVHRGLRLIRVPTTVLGQNDAGVGVKNGVDGYNVKNFAGTFAPPFAVLNDSDFLWTVPDKYFIGGLSEAFKVAIIKDRDFFNDLVAHSRQLRQRDKEATIRTVRRCAVLHLDHIRTGGDPFESGSARPLDFGHWIAHKLEKMSDYSIGHGQAVSIGIAVDSCYAEESGLLKEQELNLILYALKATGLPVWSPLLGKKTPAGRLEVMQGLSDFQEHLGGDLTITLPDGIGKKIEVHEMKEDIILNSILRLKKLFS